MLPQLSSQNFNEVPYLKGLNAAQTDAVLHLDNPLLVLAGAGTGKTRVLTTRLAHILATNRAFPSQILTVTFTNKAAQEMRHRVSSLLEGAAVEGWWLGTFHALCAKMLRRHAPLVGLNSDFTILDTDDVLRLIKQICEEFNVDVKKNPPRFISSIIERYKDKVQIPENLNAADMGDIADGKMLQIYKRYQERLKALNACDFGDLILHIVTILKDPSNGVLAEYHKKFKFILVDEYQDTNTAQYQWLRLLAQGGANICCVGDDDQSIYGWRGAEVENILKFEKDFPAAKIIRLEQNYRSTNHILKAADAVIQNNKNRLGKTLWSEKGDGEKLLTFGLSDGQAEARFVIEKISELKAQGNLYKQCAILVRAGFQMREFEEVLIQTGLPYRVFGGLRFYERQEVRDALAYVRLLAQPQDDLALQRIINLPKRGIGDATLESIHQFSRAQNISLYASIQAMLSQNLFKPKMQTALGEFIKIMESAKSLINSEAPRQIVEKLLEDSGYIAHWQNEKTIEAQGRLENLKEFTASLDDFETITEFLEHVSLVLELQNTESSDDFISIMTLHGAKGLEFDFVFLTGWEEGVFPSERSLNEKGLKGLEEERRLAYVGITRARKNAFISYAASRRLYGSWVNALPSRFIDELPIDSIESAASNGIYVRSNLGGQNNMTQRSKFYDGALPVRNVAVAQIADGFNIGDRIKHTQFGLGKIINKSGKKLDILFFNDGQTRRIMENFVEQASQTE